MAQAPRDENRIATLLGVSSSDGTTPVVLWADPTTHRLLVDLPAGTGDVVGPTSSTDTAIVRFDGTTGKLIQDSGILIDGSDNVTAIGNITGVSGDMTLTGGTASGDNLLLTSTSNGTKGFIDFGTVDTNSGMRWDEVNERLSIGGDENTITIGGTAAGSSLTVHTEGASQLYQVAWERHSDTAAFAPITIYGRSRGTEASETAVQDGDSLGTLLFIGHDGTDFERAAEITVQVDGTPGAGDMPGRMIFSVTPDGSDTLAEAMRISQDKVITTQGDVNLAASTNLQFAGTSILADSAGTMTLSNVDALDATTEATVEAAIDTLPNLTSVQGNTLTLAGDFITSGANSLTLTTTGATNVTLPTTGTLATLAGTETLTNKSIDLTDNTLTGTTAEFNTALSDGSFATLAGTETLSNKTLTAPKFADAGFIADSNGLEQLVFQETASAVNEFEMTNAATGNAPQLAVTGGDTDVDMVLAAKGTGIVKGPYKRFMVRLKDSTTALTTGTTVGGDYRIANQAITIKAVGAYVDTAAATGSNLLTIDINDSGTTILSTKITLDVGEKTSTTAATAAVISDSSIAADAIVAFDIDQVNETTPATGLVVWVDYIIT